MAYRTLKKFDMYEILRHILIASNYVRVNSEEVVFNRNCICSCNLDKFLYIEFRLFFSIWKPIGNESVPKIILHREAEKRNHFSFVCIFFNAWQKLVIFSPTSRKV